MSEHEWNDDQFNAEGLLYTLSKRLNVNDMKDWYKIKDKDLDSHFEGKLLKKRFNSLENLLSIIYPQFKWRRYKFIDCESHYWNDENNVISFIHDLENDLNVCICKFSYNYEQIEHMNDWYEVNDSQIKK